METATTRILMAANEAGLISDQEYNATSRLNTMGLIDATKLADAPPDATKNPNEFVNRMRDEARRAFQKTTEVPSENQTDRPCCSADGALRGSREHSTAGQ